jgi:hypothetical protein
MGSACSQRGGRAELDEEQHVQAPQRDRLDGEEVAGE